MCWIVINLFLFKSGVRNFSFKKNIYIYIYIYI